MSEPFFEVGRLLLRAAREFSGQVCHELRKHEHPDLKAGHALLVSNLDEGGTRVSVLAERAEVSKQAMGQLVKEMEALGYIERAKDPQDARAVLVVPTARGEKLLGDVALLAREIGARHNQKMGDSEMEQLRQTLLKWLE